MAARRKKDADAPPTGLEDAITGDSSESLKKIVLPLNSDGESVAWEHMRPDSQAKFRRILQASAFKDPSIEVEPGEISWLFDALGAIEGWIAIRFFGVHPEIAALAWQYNDAEKIALAEPAARLIKKYGGAALKYRDECAFLLTMYAVHAQKIHWITQEMKRRNTVEAEREREQAERSKQANGHDFRATAH